MNAKSIDPRRLDVAALSAARGELSGQWPLSVFPRLSDAVLDAEPPGAPVHWQAQAEQRPVTGAAPEIWLRLSAQAGVSMCCQRCLGSLPVPLDVDRWIRFVAGAAEAEALDAELEDDVLLALPLVPRHDECPEPLPMASQDDQSQPETAERPNPFAALAQLKKKPPA
jgi:uncharacterized protein